MARILLSGRVTAAQASALERYANAAGIKRYQAIIRALEIGIANLTRDAAVDAQGAALLDAMGSLLERADHIERLTQRALFASGAAYAVALRTGLDGKTAAQQDAIKTDVNRDAQRIFDRQLALATGDEATA